MSGEPARQFLSRLLATQCRQAQADAGVILRSGPADRPEILAVYPFPGNNGTSISWVARAEQPFRKVIETRETVLVRDDHSPGDGNRPQRFLMAMPIGNQGSVRAAAAFLIPAENREQLSLRQARLASTGLLLEHHELELTARLHKAATVRLRRVLDVFDAVNRSTHFLEAAMGLCNELAAWLGCSRVSLGLLDGRSVQVKALSHADTFNRRMQVIQAIEAAMEECLDQDIEVRHPAGEQTIVASRAAAVLAENHGPSAILSVPIRRSGAVVAVVTLERRPESPFEGEQEIEAIRLVCDLCAPRLMDLDHHDRWFGARLAVEARRLVGRLLGHEHTWLKLAAVTLFITGMLLATVKGEYRINAGFTFKAQQQQVIVAPYDTFLKGVVVEPGDRVEGGKTLLGTLETAELRLKLAALMAEQLGYRKQMAAAMRDQKTAEAHIADTQSQKIAAQMRLIETQIDQAKLVTPINGWVVSEDRRQRIGAPVEAGEILFEIASIDSLRAELLVPERSIAGVTDGQSGTLAAVGYPEEKIEFVIDRIDPIAEVVNHQNVFRVRARILGQRPWMRPGMEGEARITAGRKTYLWMASHRLVDWLRMKLWI